MKCDELKVYFHTIKKSIIGHTSIGLAYYSKSEVDLAIEELKQKLEDAKATAYAESVDAGMRERRLKRALWLSRALRARDKAFEYHFKNNVEMCAKWDNVHLMLMAKAEEYK